MIYSTEYGMVYSTNDEILYSLHYLIVAINQTNADKYYII